MTVGGIYEADWPAADLEGDLASAMIFEIDESHVHPVAGTFSPTGNMTIFRQESYTARPLPDDTVLIAGGL
jgi:hypothetical protein